MNEVSASKLVNILCRDPLYSDCNIALHVTHYVSSRNDAKLHFFGYLYGAGLGPIINAPRSIKYAGKSRDIERYDPLSVCNFISFHRQILNSILDCKEIFRSIDGSDIDAVSAVVQRNADLKREADEVNNIYVHMIVSFLATGLVFNAFEKTCQLNAQQLVDFFLIP